MRERLSFNVIHEPWIPVETKTGEIICVGIKDALNNAHEYRRVSAASPVFSFGIQRILIALLIDAYRPATINDLREIISKGYFDKRVLNSYISRCEADSNCFDLFDEKHPFLQTVFEEEETELIVKLFPEWPEGNNHVHFNHVYEDNHAFSPAECAQALCAISTFALNFGRSRHFGINGAPPIYFLFCGKNLFETLSCSMVAQSEHPEIPLDNPPVAWRNKQSVLSGDAVTKVSLLSGLTCQPRRIQLLGDKCGDRTIVKRMYYDKGFDYKEVINWRDPHIALKVDKKGIARPLRAKEGRAVWRDLGSILPEDTRPLILNKMGIKLSKSSENQTFPLSAYVLLGKTKGNIFAILEWYEEPMPIHLYLLEHKEKTHFTLNCLDIMEKINFETIKTLNQLDANLSAQASSQFLANSKNYFMGEFMKRLRDVPIAFEWEVPIKIEVGAHLKNMAIEVFEKTCNRISTVAKNLKWRAENEILLRYRINNCLKGGWLNEQRDESARAGEL